MKKLVSVVLLVNLFASLGSATVVYQNSFDLISSLDDFTVYGESFAFYNPPPLHEVFIDSGRLRIETDYLQPNGEGTPPTLDGEAMLTLNTSVFSDGYNSTLSQNDGLISWSFNIAYQDGSFNNMFKFVLVSSAEDPSSPVGTGYYFKGGGMVEDRMGLWRFDNGIGGGETSLIDIPEGLGKLPEMGSFKITFNPFTDEWSLFGEIGNEFLDATAVDNLMGTQIDGTYTDQALPFMGLGGSTTGVDLFDNVTVAVVPEPSVTVLSIGALALLFVFVRKFRRKD